MENVIYAAAVLGSLCVDNAAGPGIVANVLQALHSIDQRILVLAPPDCPRCDGDWLPEEEALFKQAGEQLERLKTTLGLKVELHYNNQVPEAARSRLRLEVPAQPTAWDVDSPLYLS